MNNHKKIILAIVLITGLLILGSLVWYFIFSAKSGIFQPSEKLLPAPEDEAAPQFRVFIKPSESKHDKDKDGLSDIEEEKLGTSDLASDSDGDGLSDNIEINITKTDPAKFDTDGDGYGDGLEVVTGYNPLGPGKLE